MPKTAGSSSYSPTTGELTKFIDDYLEEFPKASTTSILEAMKTKKKSWNVPERRANKIVKKKKSSAMDDEMETGSVVSRVRKGITKRFGKSEEKKKSIRNSVKKTLGKEYTSRSAASSSPPRVIKSSSSSSPPRTSSASSTNTAKTAASSVSKTPGKPKDVMDPTGKKITVKTKKIVVKTKKPDPEVKNLASDFDKKAVVEAKAEPKIETKAKVESLEIHDAYKDDNDGKPEPTCCKGSQANGGDGGCVIM